MRIKSKYMESASVALLVLLGISSCLLTGCSMGEEIRRIEESKKAGKMRDASNSTNLTGDQIFVRSCNTCHPGGKEGMGPRLDKMKQDFPTDDALKKFLRKGKGMMPPQSPGIVSDVEMDSLVIYLRTLNNDLNEAK